MTNRYFALTVLLDVDMREDDAEAVINAIWMIKHVQAVEAHVANSETWAAEKRVRRNLERKLWEVLQT